MKIIKNIWQILVGKPFEESLEARIFHAVCILSVFTLAFSVVFNYFIGLEKLAAIMLVVFLMVLIFYYYSRFRAKTTITILFYGILSHIVFAINYYFNSGISGPTLLIFIASLFLIVSIAPPKQFWFWITFNIVIVLTLLYIQFNHSSEVPYTYPSLLSKYCDIAVTYIVIIFLIFSITKYVRYNYVLERKAVEEKAAELEVSNDTKNKLLSILAHDLKSPLDSIQSYLELLANTTLNSEERHYVEKVLLEKTLHTGQVLSNLLSWTRAQMQGVTVTMETYNLSEILNPTMKQEEAIAFEKGITIKNSLTDSNLVIADKDMLQLVIRNLLNNAIKFAPSGTEIVISDVKKDSKLILSISDNGIGIAPEKQKEIFSLKAKSTYGTNKEKGVGLGLVLCKEFVEMQNGSIWFESKNGSGTTFFISLNTPS